jgi:hypothetical protein
MKNLLLSLAAFTSVMGYSQSITITEIGRYTDSRDGACEISAYDKDSKKIFVTNAASDSIDIVDISNPMSPSKIGGINVLNYGGGVNSVVSLGNGYFAAAIEATVKQDSGFVVFFDTAGTFISSVKVGALPDMVTVTKDGTKVLVANEGEPSDDYLTDPKGSIGIIDISGGIPSVSDSDLTLLFFDNAPSIISGSIKKPGTTYATDLEPEYIAINNQSTKAAVVCQESNVLILLDLVNDSILGYKGLGFKDHSIVGNGMDVSNRDNKIQINTWPVKGIYQPDAIASFQSNGFTYWVSANEGDARDYIGYSSEERIKDLTLDSTVFPNAGELQNDTNLGRLKTLSMDMVGDIDNDGDVDELYSYGARSFSIWDSTGTLVWDSKDQFEQYIKANHISFFNCDNGEANDQDSRSDDKGAEPEAITTGVLNNTIYAFIGLERQGGIMVYDISNPTAPIFNQYIHTMDTVSGKMIDIAPEGLIFVPANESHTGKAMLIVSNELSGTTTIYEVVVATNVSISERNISNFSIYPNPTSGIINFKGDFIPKSVRIMDITGKIVMETSLSSSNFNIEFLNRGLYFGQFFGENDEKITKRIVKQ